MQFVELVQSALPSEISIENELKAGGEGSVFVGKFNGEPAAIKLFKPDTDPNRRDREIECLEKIDCKSLVKTLGVVIVEIQGIEHVVVAYELHRGGDLCSFVEGSPVVPDFEFLLQVTSDVAIAIDSLWRHRIVHRDIKPANIVQSDSGGFVLVDVGLARHIDRSDLTIPGLSAGTLGYMSPEQAIGRRSLTFKSDVFSLGITLYELAASRHPFNRNQSLIGRSTPNPLFSHRKDLPREYCRFVDSMLHSRPSERPKDVVEFVSDFWS